MRLTKNFKEEEFIYSRFYNTEKQNRVVFDFYNNKNIHHNTTKLAIQLQVLRDYLNLDNPKNDYSIDINIAYRPKWYELEKKRSGNSMHCLGIAADIVSNKFTPSQLYNTIEYLINEGLMLQGGLGKYDSFTHYDLSINGKKRRW